jgi:hypothetical protein
MRADEKPYKKPPSPVYWILTSVVLVFIDYYTGPFIQFPVTFLIPVALASWYNDRWWGIALALILPLLRFYYGTFLWAVPWSLLEASINGLIRMAILLSFAILVKRIARQTGLLQKEVHILEGLLPICSFCKKIRDEDGHWEQLEKYISQRSAADFSHGVCPECMEKHYSHVFRKMT